MPSPTIIVFPERPAPWYDIDDHTLTFPVLIDGLGYACVVTVNGLMRRFANAPPSTPTEAFVVYERHRNEIYRLTTIIIHATTNIGRSHRFRIPLIANDFQSPHADPLT